MRLNNNIAKKERDAPLFKQWRDTRSFFILKLLSVRDMSFMLLS